MPHSLHLARKLHRFTGASPLSSNGSGSSSRPRAQLERALASDALERATSGDSTRLDRASLRTGHAAFDDSAGGDRTGRRVTWCGVATSVAPGTAPCRAARFPLGTAPSLWVANPRDRPACDAVPACSSTTSGSVLGDPGGSETATDANTYNLLQISGQPACPNATGAASARERSARPLHKLQGAQVAAGWPRDVDGRHRW